MVNNLIERKGVVEFLQALENANLNAAQFQLLLIGGDNLEPEYALECKKNGKECR